MLLKCKKCGTQIEVPDGTFFAECKNCGDRQNISNPFSASDNARIEAIYQKAVASLGNARTETELSTVRGQFEIIISYKDSQQKIEECEKKLVECIYNNALTMLRKAEAPIQFADARAKFESIGNYKDSLQMIKECDKKYELARKDDLYNAAVGLLNNSSDVGEIELAIMQLDSIIGHRDAREQIQNCKNKIEQLKHADTQTSTNAALSENEDKGVSKMKIAVIAAVSVAVLGGIVAALVALL